MQKSCAGAFPWGGRPGALWSGGEPLQHAGRGSDESPGMIELTVLLGVVGGLAAFAWVPWPVLLELAFGLSAVGLAVGIPGALVYHVRLHAGLRRAGPVPAGWWVHPFGHHRRLSPEELDRVLPPCWIGAGGGALAFLGCLAGGLGVLSAWLAGGG